MTQEKIEKIQAYCAEQNFDWLIFANFGHEVQDSMLYFVLLRNPEHGVLLIPKKGRPIFYVTSFEVGEISADFPEIDVRPLNNKFATHIGRTVPPEETIGLRTGVIPEQAYTALVCAGHKVSPATGLEKIIAEKTMGEIKAMRAVTALTDVCFSELVRAWHTFKTEFDAARFVSNFAIQNNVELSFPAIVATGRSAAHPHHHTEHSTLTGGFCVIDMGFRQNGYCSDMSRTVFLGNPTADEIDLYERLRSVQEKTAALVAPGLACAGLDIFCRAELKNLNHYFIHGLGHGLGTQVHEWPGINGKNTELLRPGMIITIEPGIYKENEFGIRIEDDVLVTESSNEILTKSSRELIRLPVGE